MKILDWVEGVLALELEPAPLDKLRQRFRGFEYAPSRIANLSEKKLESTLKSLKANGVAQRKERGWEILPALRLTKARAALNHAPLRKEMHLWGLATYRPPALTYLEAKSLLLIALLLGEKGLPAYTAAPMHLIPRIASAHPQAFQERPPLELLSEIPGFDSFFDSLEIELQAECFHYELQRAFFHLEPLGPRARAFVEHVKPPESLNQTLQLALDLQELYGLRRDTFTVFLEEGHEAALRDYRKREFLRTLPNLRFTAIDHHLRNLALALGRLARGKANDLRWLERAIPDTALPGWGKAFFSLHLVAKAWRQTEIDDLIWLERLRKPQHPLEELFSSLFNHWFRSSEEDLASFQRLSALAKEASFEPLARALDALVAKQKGEDFGHSPLAKLQPVLPRWRRRLRVLERFTHTKGETRRLIWRLRLSPLRGSISGVELRIQRKGKRGWSKGELIDPSSLNSDHPLTSQDRNALRCLKRLKWSQQWDFDALLTALVDHPLLFDHFNPQQRLTLSKARPLVRLHETKERALANDLLEGSGAATSLDIDALMGLLK